jgi:hypothetical protein
MNAEVQQHETLQDVPGGRTQQRLVQECHVDGAECEVMAHIMPALAEQCGSDDKTQDRLGQSVGEARRRLPCSGCRAVTVAAAQLPRTRLGRRERDLLLRAGAADTNSGELVCGAAEPHAAKEAKMRAARKLKRMGLVWTGYKEVTTERRDRRGCIVQIRRFYVVVAGLTPLGAEIKRRYLAELQQGRAIRWDERVAESAAAARHDCQSLIAQLEQGLIDELPYLKRIVGLVGSANPVGARDYVERLQAVNRVINAITATKATARAHSKAVPDTRSVTVVSAEDFGG